MNSILFSSNGADELNKLVQSEIAPHLFVVSGYNPNDIAFSDDARFILAVTNLYKFVIETSIIRKFSDIDENMGGLIERDIKFYGFKKWVGTTSVLRTYYCHNNEADNETETSVKEWLLKAIGKEKIETEADYSKALNELYVVGDNVYSFSNKVIKAMVDYYGSNKDDLILQFERAILAFYKNNYKKLISQEIRKAYLAKVPTLNGDISIRQLSLWCQNKYCGVLKRREEELRSLLGNCSDSSGRKKLEELIAKIDRELLTKQKEIANYNKKEVNRLKAIDYYDFYIKDVYNRLESYIPEIKDKNYTMLPHDIVQYIIVNDFKGIPIMDV